MSTQVLPASVSILLFLIHKFFPKLPKRLQREVFLSNNTLHESKNTTHTPTKDTPTRKSKEKLDTTSQQKKEKQSKSKIMN